MKMRCFSAEEAAHQYKNRSVYSEKVYTLQIWTCKYSTINRHTASPDVRLRRRGHRALQEMLGHTSLTTTEIYTVKNARLRAVGKTLLLISSRK